MIRSTFRKILHLMGVGVSTTPSNFVQPVVRHRRRSAHGAYRIFRSYK